MFLPWFVGNVVDSPTGEHYYGFVSTWGIFYDGKLHNAHEVFASGFWDIVTFLVSGSSVTYLNVTKSMCTIGTKVHFRANEKNTHHCLENGLLIDINCMFHVTEIRYCYKFGPNIVD